MQTVIITIKKENKTGEKGGHMAGPARYSKKREAILQVLRDTDVHPTADWVYQQLKPQYPDLSLGTVYRNLTRFKEEGVVVSVGTVNGQERFDATVEPHTHFICKSCGAVLDFHGLRLDNDLDRRAEEEFGMKIDHHELVFQGTCSKCLNAPTH